MINAARLLNSAVDLSLLKKPTEPVSRPSAPSLPPQRARPHLAYLGSGIVNVNGEAVLVSEAIYMKGPIRRDILEFAAKNGDPLAIHTLELESSVTQTKARYKPEQIARQRDEILKREWSRIAVLDLVRDRYRDPETRLKSTAIFNNLAVGDVSKITNAPLAIWILGLMKEYHYPTIERLGQYELLKQKILSGKKESTAMFQSVKKVKRNGTRQSEGQLRGNGGIFVRSSDGYTSGYPLLENPADDLTVEIAHRMIESGNQLTPEIAQELYGKTGHFASEPGFCNSLIEAHTNLMQESLLPPIPKDHKRVVTTIGLRLSDYQTQIKPMIAAILKHGVVPQPEGTGKYSEAPHAVFAMIDYPPGAKEKRLYNENYPWITADIPFSDLPWSDYKDALNGCVVTLFKIPPEQIIALNGLPIEAWR